MAYLDEGGGLRKEPPRLYQHRNTTHHREADDVDGQA
jgi:hypothetical protein